MVTLTRRIVVPTLVLGTIVALVVAASAWESVRELRALERDTNAVRAAGALAYALGDAAQEEDRLVLSLAAHPDPTHEARLARVGDHIGDLMSDIGRLPLAPRAAAVWEQLGESRAALLSRRDAALEGARRGDVDAIAEEVTRWRLMTARSDALLKDFTGYHLRFLDRTVAKLQDRRARALRATTIAAALGLLLAAVLAVAVSRAVVRPIVAVAHAAERIADTGRLSEVGGASRDDEIGTLARAFNRMTERLFAANAQLAESDRRKDEFLGMLSHELRNPLAPMRNSLHLLDRVDPASAPARRAREVMKRQLEHLTRLVDDLLDVTRIARGKIELRRARLDLGDLVRRSAEDHAELMRQQGHEFRIETPPEGTLWVEGDATRLAQVIGNLLQNAAKFTPRGGRVTVSAHGSGGSAEIRVGDTGTGIEPQLLPHVFEPFTQAKQTLARSEGGLGLGLAVVKGMTELHGGTVGVESAGAGKGAEFLVRLPLAAPAPAAGERAAPASTRRQVLVVDDNEDAADSLADLLRMLGHAVDVAYDGPSAVEKARARRPSVVLCDLGLPGMSGYEVARALRAEHRDGADGDGRIRLIAVSGYAQPDDVRSSAEAGFDGHLAKPARLEDLERLLA